VKSAAAGWQRDLTSEVNTNPEVDMLHSPVLPDSIAGRADVLPPRFGCSWTGGGPDAAWVHIVGELDIATTPQFERTLREAQLEARLVVLDLRELAFMDSVGVHAIVNAGIRARQVARRLLVLRGPPNVDRVLTLAGRRDDVAIHDLDAVDPPVQLLLRLVEAELTS
jgi:anti-anti-sigma factor